MDMRIVSVRHACSEGAARPLPCHASGNCDSLAVLDVPCQSMHKRTLGPWAEGLDLVRYLAPARCLQMEGVPDDWATGLCKRHVEIRRPQSQGRAAVVRNAWTAPECTGCFIMPGPQPLTASSTSHGRERGGCKQYAGYTAPCQSPPLASDA